MIGWHGRLSCVMCHMKYMKCAGFSFSCWLRNLTPLTLLEVLEAHFRSKTLKFVLGVSKNDAPMDPILLTSKCCLNEHAFYFEVHSLHSVVSLHPWLLGQVACHVPHDPGTALWSFSRVCRWSTDINCTDIHPAHQNMGLDSYVQPALRFHHPLRSHTWIDSEGGVILFLGGSLMGASFFYWMGEGSLPSHKDISIQWCFDFEH